MFNAENAIKKWGPVLDHGSAPKIKDAYRRAVTATLLENQERAMKEERAHSLNEGTGAAGNGGFDPILISLVRRAMPNLIAYDIAGVQPMSAPTGLIFALRSKYGGTPATGAEALYGGRNVSTVTTVVTSAAATVTSTVNAVGLFTVTLAATSSVYLTGAAAAGSAVTGAGIPAGAFLVTPALNNASSILISHAITGAVSGLITVTPSATFTAPISDTFSGPKDTADLEGNINAEMGFQIEKTTVTAKTRALKAEYTMELAQDLKAVHGLDAESELANILSTEILLEINREVINKINAAAVLGGRTATAGAYDLANAADNDGRWSVSYTHLTLPTKLL
jgi:hypothetical protein